MLNRRTRMSLSGWTDRHWRRRLHIWTLLEGLASMTKVSRRRRRAVRHVKTRTWSEVAWRRSIATVLRIIAPDVRWLRIAWWREGGEATVLRRWALTLAMCRTRGVLEINRQLKVRQFMFSNINSDSDQKEGNGEFPQQFALSEQVCDLHPVCFIIRVVLKEEQHCDKAGGARRKVQVTHHDSRIVQDIGRLWFGLLPFFGYLNVLDIASPKYNVVEFLL